jgi:hypothetical protein
MPESGIAFLVVHGSVVLYAVGANEGVMVVGVRVVGTAVGETPPVSISTATRFVLPLVYGVEELVGASGPL